MRNLRHGERLKRTDNSPEDAFQLHASRLTHPTVFALRTGVTVFALHAGEQIQVMVSSGFQQDNALPDGPGLQARKGVTDAIFFGDGFIKLLVELPKFFEIAPEIEAARFEVLDQTWRYGGAVALVCCGILGMVDHDNGASGARLRACDRSLCGSKPLQISAQSRQRLCGFKRPSQCARMVSLMQNASSR